LKGQYIYVPGQMEGNINTKRTGTSTQNIQHMQHHLHFKLNTILLSLVNVTVIRTDLNCAKTIYNKSETVTVIKPEWGHQKPLLLTILSSQHMNFDYLFGVWCSTSDYKALAEKYIRDNQPVKQPISEMCSSH